MIFLLQCFYLNRNQITGAKAFLSDYTSGSRFFRKQWAYFYQNRTTLFKQTIYYLPISIMIRSYRKLLLQTAEIHFQWKLGSIGLEVQTFLMLTLDWVSLKWKLFLKHLWASRRGRQLFLSALIASVIRIASRTLF